MGSRIGVSRVNYDIQAFIFLSCRRNAAGHVVESRRNKRIGTNVQDKSGIVFGLNMYLTRMISGKNRSLNIR